MKIFVSWSKPKSQKFALAFRDWLPQVIQSAEPFVSSRDISLGVGWLEDIERRLDEYKLGLIFVTRENLDSPWLHYEAGALSRAVGDADRRVVPILVDIEVNDLVGSPLSNFQNVVGISRQSFLELCHSINEFNEVPLDKSVLDGAFGKWWEDLKLEFDEVEVVNAQEGSDGLPGLIDKVDILTREIIALRHESRHQSELRKSESVGGFGQFLRHPNRIDAQRKRIIDYLEGFADLSRSDLANLSYRELKTELEEWQHMNGVAGNKITHFEDFESE